MAIVINNRYEVVKLIGRGGFGNVFKVKDLHEYNKVLALKKIRSTVTTTRTLNIFKYEFKFLTSLNHPNLVKVYEFDVDKETDEFFFTMEFIEGSSLYAVLREDMSWDKVESYFVQAARALSFIHAKGIIHYDIKPDNIFIDGDGNLKIMDFGFAGTKDDSKARGTLQFLSPDFALKREITHKVDFFSLGVAFYYSIADVLPFKGDKREEIIINSAKENYIHIEEIEKSIPSYLAEVISRLMTIKEANRFEFGTDLIRYINNKGDKSYKLFTAECIRAHITSGKMIGRKNEVDFLKKKVFRLFNESRFFDNKPIFIIGKKGNGKHEILREFRYVIQTKDEVDYYRATFIENDARPFQVFDIIIEEMKRRYNIEDNMLPEEYYELSVNKTLSEEGAFVENKISFLMGMAQNLVDFFIEISHMHKYIFEIENFENANSISIYIIEEIIKKMRDFPEREISFAILTIVQEENLKPYHSSFITKYKKNIDILRIQAFDFEETANYIKGILNIENFPDDYSKFIYSVTMGIKFYIDEMLIYMFRNGMLFLHSGKWIADKNFPVKMEKNPREMIYDNFKTFPEIEQIIIKEIYLLKSPISIDILSVFDQVYGIKESQAIKALYSLYDKEIIEKIKYAKGYQYYISKQLMLECVKDDFDDEYLKEIYFLNAEFIKKRYGVNTSNILQLANCYYYSGNIDKAKPILKIAVNVAFENNNLELALIYLKRLYKIEKLLKNRNNLFISLINTLFDLYHYREVLNYIETFKQINFNFKLISANNLLDINLISFKCALKIVDKEILDKSKQWLLSKLNYTGFSKHKKAELFIWFADYTKGTGHFNESLKYLKKAQKILESLKSNLLALKCYMKRGEIYGIMGNSKKGFDFVNVALRNFEVYSDTGNIIKSHLALGELFYLNGNLIDSKEFYNKAKEEAQESKNLYFEISASIGIAKINILNLDFSKTKNLLTETLKILRNSTDKKFESEIFSFFAIMYFLEGRKNRALKFIDKCILIRESIDLDFELKKGLLIKSIILSHYYPNRKNEALVIIDKIEESIIPKSFKLYKDYTFFTEMFYLYGFAVLCTGNISKRSFKFLKTQIKIQKKNYDIFNIIFVNIFWGIINVEKGKSNKALEKFEFAYGAYVNNSGVFNDNRVLKIIVEIIYNHYVSYTDQYSLGVMGLSNLIQYLDSFNLPYIKGIVNYYLGKIYYDMAELKRAQSCLRTADTKFKEVSDDIGKISKIVNLLNKITKEQEIK